jgi:hypothetical protein
VRTSDFTWGNNAYMREVMRQLMVCIGYVIKAQILFIDHSCTFMYPCTLHVFSFWWTPIFIIKGCVREFYSLIVILLWEMHQNIHIDVLDIWFICPKFWFSHIDCRKALLSMGNVGGIELLMSWKVCMGSFSKHGFNQVMGYLIVIG